MNLNKTRHEEEVKLQKEESVDENDRERNNRDHGRSWLLNSYDVMNSPNTNMEEIIQEAGGYEDKNHEHGNEPENKNKNEK